MAPSTNSKALAKRSESTALMPPPPAPKRVKRPSVVLSEDTYVSAVDHIIGRDFFPGVTETNAQHEYLSAVESENKAWIREAGKNLTQVMTPVPDQLRKRAARTRFERPGGDLGRTPSVWGADTPVSEPKDEEDEEGLSKLDQVDLNMSLGAFQAKYTSEDQESFNQLLDKDNKARFERNEWVRQGNRYASKQRIAQQKVIEARASTSQSQDLVVSSRPSQNLDDRPAAPNSHKHAPFNTLMFEPDSIEQWTQTRAQTAENASLAPPKQVVYNNTRLPLETEPPRPPSPTLSAVRDAVAGRPRFTPSEAGGGTRDTPRVNGYAFVTAPLATSDSEDDAPTDLLARYGIEGSGAATPFTLQDSSAREKMHHKMVEQIAAKRSNPQAANANGPAKTPGGPLGIFTTATPRFLSAPTPAGRLAGGKTPGGGKAKADLTPAAQKLFERMGGGKVPNLGGEGFGAGASGDKAWTPTPRVKRRM